MARDKCTTCDDKGSIIVFNAKKEQEIYGCPECNDFPEAVKKKIRAVMKKRKWVTVDRRLNHGK